MPRGRGYFYAAYDSRRVLNTIVDRGYLPRVKPRKNRGIRIFDKEKYKRREICEEFFGALTNWFENRIPCSLVKTAVTRLLVRVACYALRILRVSIKEME